MPVDTAARYWLGRGAKGGTRTRTGVTRQNLNLVRLPIPPLSLVRHPLYPCTGPATKKAPGGPGALNLVGCEGFEPSTY